MWKKIWKWIKSIWPLVSKLLVAIAGIIVFLMISKKLTDIIRQAILGKVEKPQGFMKVPGREDIILIENKGKYETVELPAEIKASSVRAAGIIKGGKVHVEIKHKVVDRRNPVDASNGDSAASHWSK